MSGFAESVAFWRIDANNDQLRRLWAAGDTGVEIGRKMHLSKSAVIGRAHRLGLPARPSPIRPSATPGAQKVARAQAVTLAPLAVVEPEPERAAIQPSVAAQAVKPAAADEVIPVAKMQCLDVDTSAAVCPPATEATHHAGRRGRVVACSFVTGTVGRKHSFCEASSVPGSLWCADHRRRCVTLPRAISSAGASA